MGASVRTQALYVACWLRRLLQQMGCSASRVEPQPALAKTAEQLAAEAELAELRRLTPEQEAAAAEAAHAAHQRSVCEKSRLSPRRSLLHLKSQTLIV